MPLLQIYLLQDKYDRMNEAHSKTGGVLYFEPLRYELNDCFGALKNVQPDSVFSSREGMIIHPSASDDADDVDHDDTENNSQAVPSTSSTDVKQKDKKKKTKSDYFQPILLTTKLQLTLKAS